MLDRSRRRDENIAEFYRERHRCKKLRTELAAMRTELAAKDAAMDHLHGELHQVTYDYASLLESRAQAGPCALNHIRIPEHKEILGFPMFQSLLRGRPSSSS